MLRTWQEQSRHKRRCTPSQGTPPFFPMSQAAAYAAIWESKSSSGQSPLPHPRAGNYVYERTWPFRFVQASTDPFSERLQRV